jgi:hypothetical protein
MTNFFRGARRCRHINESFGEFPQRFFKTPSSKLQAPEKFQPPSSKTDELDLKIGAWCFFGA